MPTYFRRCSAIFFFRAFLFFGCVFLAQQQVFSQVNDIKRGSDDNKKDRDKSSGGGGGSSGSSGSSSSGGLGFSAGRDGLSISDCNSFLNCFDLGLGFFNGFWAHQNRLLQNKENNPRIFSLEIFPTFTYDFKKTVAALPRARINWGMLSTDFRFNYLYTIKEGSYQTVDWQVVQLNIFSKEEFYLRLGTGLMYEPYNKVTFNEHTLGADVLLEPKLRGSFELRLAHDATTKIIPRTEAGIRLTYELTSDEKKYMGLTLGLMYQNYYHSVILINGQIGLVFILF